MSIKRINSYHNKRFQDIVLKQHGGFLIDNKYPCEFLITRYDCATVYYHDYYNIDKIIDNYRFYAKHITKFYDAHGKLLKVFNDVVIQKNNINLLQPSQFYVDSDKIQLIST